MKKLKKIIFIAGFLNFFWYLHKKFFRNKKKENLIKEFFLGKEKNLPKVPWNVLDAIKMIILTGVVLFALSWGSFEVCKILFGEMRTAFWILDNLKLLIIVGMLMQIFVEIIFLYIFTHRKYGNNWSDFGFKETSIWSTLKLGILLFSLVAIGQNIFVLGMETIGIRKIADQQILEFLISEKQIPIWFLFVFAGILAPLTEELIFRGFLLGALLPKIGYPFGVTVAALIFSAAHLNLDSFLLLFLLGALLSVLYIRTKSLWPGIIFHSINNTIALALLASKTF